MDKRAEPDVGSVGADIQDRSDLSRAQLEIDYPDRPQQDGLTRRTSNEWAALNRYRKKYFVDGVRTGQFRISRPIGDITVKNPDLIPFFDPDTTPLS